MLKLLNLINENIYLKKTIILSIDFFLILVALWLSFAIRLGELYWFPKSEYYSNYILLIVAAYIIFFSISFIFGFYRVVIRFIGLNTIFLISKIILFFAILWGIFALYLAIPGFPRSLIIIYPIVLAILIYLSRQTFQSIVINFLYHGKSDGDVLRKKSVVIYGSGDAGIQLYNVLKQSGKYSIKYLIDDDKKKIGRSINGTNIISFKTFLKSLSKNKYDEVHLAIPNLNKIQKREIINKLNNLDIRIRTLPPIEEFINKPLNEYGIKNLDIEDLLQRNALNLEDNIYEDAFRNKTVLITGAGGSIGSELSRQIYLKNPRVIILFDVSEYSIYKVTQDLENLLDKGRNNSFTQIISIIGSIQDLSTLSKTISKWKPHIIYHAAAYKHVPIVEENISEGFKNNVLGTMNVALLSVKFNVENFVLVSTDKAVRPTNSMGITKRIAELILQGISNEKTLNLNYINKLNEEKEQKTNFSIVRFGNVYESSGSVIPLFKKQIIKGGPLTVTHEDITRYFMTVKEAAQLVILAGTLSRLSDPATIYLLDMGEPIKIMDLAKKIIIQSGLSLRNQKNTDGDIEIKIIGLRPGEKIYEELLISGEPEKTKFSKIYRSQEPFKKWSILINEILEFSEDLEKNINHNDILKNKIEQIIK